MGGYDNNTSRSITNDRRIGGRINAARGAKLYKEYIDHPRAQWIMTFAQYKKVGLRKKLLK